MELFATYDKQLNFIQNNIQKEKCQQWINEWKLPTLDPKKKKLLFQLPK